jgi:hypothetical protein
LDAALARLTAEELFWFCETRRSGPLYVLPSSEFVRALAREIRKIAAPGDTVLEIAAGDGFLTQCLRQAEPELRWLASDSGAWEDPRARLSAAEDRHLPELSGLHLGAGVERREATGAIRKHRPDIVLAAWLPPGPLFEHLLRSPCRYLIEIGAAGGVTGQGEWGWRFAHDFLSPALERLARSRLDAGGARRTQLTLYFGRRHPEFREERPRAGEWLAQFKPAKPRRSRRGAATT